MTRGITVVPLIIALVLMIAVGTFFISLMLGRNLGAPLLALTTKALYISDAGVEYSSGYLGGYSDWTTVPDISSTSFGGGTFAVAFTNKAQGSVTATSTGTNGTATRIVSIDFTRVSELALNPVTYLDDYAETPVGGPTIYCEGGTPCDPASPIDDPPYTCLCTYEATTAEAPIPIPPTGVTWSNLTISADSPLTGTYYVDNLIINTGVHVTVSGTATIWIRVKLDMKQSSTFNFGSPYGIGDYGDPANLLLISAASGTNFWLRQSSKFSGGIYAPNGTVDIKNGDAFVGAIVGNSVQLHNNTTITFDPDAGTGSGGYIGTFGIIPSGWGET
jgi:hypothetical protein